MATARHSGGLLQVISGGPAEREASAVIEGGQVAEARFVELLVERTDISTEGLNVRFRIDGLSGLAREMLAGAMERAA